MRRDASPPLSGLSAVLLHSGPPSLPPPSMSQKIPFLSFLCQYTLLPRRLFNVGAARPTIDQDRSRSRRTLFSIQFSKEEINSSKVLLQHKFAPKVTVDRLSMCPPSSTKQPPPPPPPSQTARRFERKRKKRRRGERGGCHHTHPLLLQVFFSVVRPLDRDAL